MCSESAACANECECVVRLSRLSGRQVSKSVSLHVQYAIASLGVSASAAHVV